MTKKYIAGPYLVEGFNQIFKAAKALAAQEQPPLYLFSRVYESDNIPSTIQQKKLPPNNAMRFLKLAAEGNNLKWCTEAATVQQLSKALFMGCDAIYIDSSAASNLHLVDEMFQLMSTYNKRNKKLTVFLPNPVDGDFSLWRGNIIRLKSLGLEVIAVHSGVYTSLITLTKRTPQWSEMAKITLSDLEVQVFTACNEIAGISAGVHDIASISHAIGGQGLVIECSASGLESEKRKWQSSSIKEIPSLLEYTQSFAEGKDLSFVVGNINVHERDLFNLMKERWQLMESASSYAVGVDQDDFSSRELDTIDRLTDVLGDASKAREVLKPIFQIDRMILEKKRIVEND